MININKLRPILSDEMQLCIEAENTPRGLSRASSLPGLQAKKTNSVVLFRPEYKANRISRNSGIESVNSIPLGMDNIVAHSTRSKDSTVDNDKHKLMWQLMSEYLHHEPEHVLNQIQHHV
jgi:hypothetical protein